MEAMSSLILCLLVLVFIMTVIFLALSLRIVQEDTRLSVYRLGRFIGDKGPGIVYVIPFVDRAVLKKLSEVEKIPIGRFSGDIGETRTTIFTDGKVFIAGEEWDATSQSPIPAGQRVRVVRMILEVERE